MHRTRCPGRLMLLKRAVLELMQQAFICGSTWECECAANRAHTVQTMMHAVRAFLDARRDRDSLVISRDDRRGRRPPAINRTGPL